MRKRKMTFEEWQDLADRLSIVRDVLMDAEIHVVQRVTGKTHRAYRTMQASVKQLDHARTELEELLFRQFPDMDYLVLSNVFRGRKDVPALIRKVAASPRGLGRER